MWDRVKTDRKMVHPNKALIDCTKPSLYHVALAAATCNQLRILVLCHKFDRYETLSCSCNYMYFFIFYLRIIVCVLTRLKHFLTNWSILPGKLKTKGFLQRISVLPFKLDYMYVIFLLGHCRFNHQVLQTAGHIVWIFQEQSESCLLNKYH